MPRWALLFGIDFYPTRPLKGCVNDINIIHKYVERNTPKDQISVLTATRNGQPGFNKPVEEPARWPTISNIKASLSAILFRAVPGDKVYIHYSGHGDRLLSPKSPWPHVVTDHHVALVVLNETATDTEEFLGTEFARYLHQMVKKGLLVSIVLDCCFSGSVYRENGEFDSAVRTLAKLPSQKHRPNDTRQYARPESRLRNAQTLPSWIVDPDGYLIIVACGPHEIAREEQFEGKYHGALSYHLNESFKMISDQNGRKISYHTFLSNLVLKVHSVSGQTPMSYGDLRHYFFEGVTADVSTDLVSVSMSDSRLILEAGLAHGVSLGDEYAIFHFNSAENEAGGLADALFTTEVLSVRHLTSTLKQKDADGVNLTNCYGLKAKLIDSKSTEIQDIGLVGNEMLKDRLIQAARSHPFIKFSNMTGVKSPHSNFVHCSEDEICSILDENENSITGLRPMLSSSDHHFNRLVDVIAHVARYNYFKTIKTPYPEPALKSKLTFELRNLARAKYDLDTLIEVIEGTELILQLTNTDKDSTLYVTILNFTPLWQIHCITAHLNKSGACVIPPRNLLENFTGTDNVAWKMQVPEECRSRGSCEDTIKVIVSSLPTSFHNLLLPEIKEIMGASGRKIQIPTSATSRGSIYRQFTGDSSDQEEAVIFSFHVKTFCK